MSWCPNCLTEYREGFNTCKECKEKLVNQLPFSTQDIISLQEMDEIVYLGTFSDGVEINIVESLLKAHGIPVLKKYKGIGGYLKIIMEITRFGVAFYVPSKALDEAKELLRDFCGRRSSGEEFEALEHSIYINPWKRRVIGVIILTLLTSGIGWTLYHVIRALFQING